MLNVDDASQEKKVVLPTEMVSMVSLRTLIGKLIQKCYADLVILTETLPSMSDVERKRQILNYATSSRKQFLKLYVLVKWAENAGDIQMSQNIMAFLANQNKTFQDTVDYLHKIYAELPAARVRNFDVLTAVDVLTTGTYQRMPRKLKDTVPPPPLADKEVLDTLIQMNDVIRMHMLTKEVLPAPMEDYRIENGRIYFTIENEFEVSLTLRNPNNLWHIVSLDILVKSASSAGIGDVDLSLKEEEYRLRENARRQLLPMPYTKSVDPGHRGVALNSGAEGGETPNEEKSPVFFPLVNLYDYLHLFCLNMQLEILHMQADMLKESRWINQLDVKMDATRTRLMLAYWGNESSIARWGCPQALADQSDPSVSSTRIEISIGNEAETDKVGMVIGVRDELQGLVQRAGIGASVKLVEADSSDKQAIFSALKYPKNRLEIQWGGEADFITQDDLLNPSDLNVERLLHHVTAYHGRSIINRLRALLLSQSTLLQENGLVVAEVADKEKAGTPKSTEDSQEQTDPLVIQYRLDRFIRIDLDSRTGYVRVNETGRENLNEFLKDLEERLSKDPKNIATYLIMFRSRVVIREIVSLAKQLNLQPCDSSKFNLRSDDEQARMLGLTAAPPFSQKGESVSSKNKTMDAQSSVLLQFIQFEDWYIYCGVVKNKIQLRLCCIKKVYGKSDKDESYHELAHVIPIEYEQLLKEKSPTEKLPNEKLPIGYHRSDKENEHRPKKRLYSLDQQIELGSDQLVHANSKRKRVFASVENTSIILPSHRPDVSDSLSVDLRFMAMVDSLSRAYIINAKIESQLDRRSLPYKTWPLLKTVSPVEAQTINNPLADQMKAICVSQQDLLRECERDEMGNKPKELLSWIHNALPRIRNEVVMRPTGLWSSDRSECYVVMQDRIDLKDMPVNSCEINDRISLDSSTGILSFTYTEIDSCVQEFLKDWEHILMMINIARQMSSKWLLKYNDNLEFDSFDLQVLKFTYAKDYTCQIRWRSSEVNQPCQYVVQLGTKTAKTKTKVASLPLSPTRNPHWRVTMFLQERLNERLDLISFIQTLFQTLPLMVCLETLELESVLKGGASKVSIIPRAADSVRVLFSSTQALDIRFTNATTVFVSDAAYANTFLPFLTAANRRQQQQQQKQQQLQQQQQQLRHQGDGSTDGVQTLNKTPGTGDTLSIHLGQPIKFTPFTRFEVLLEKLEEWIFQNSRPDHPAIRSSEAWMKPFEPSAVAFPNGMLCSVTLCPELFFRLEQ